jgi:hypothetical protein
MRILSILTLVTLTMTLSVQAEDKPKHDSFASCVSSSLQGGNGGVAAEAAARKACREQFPVNNSEIEAKNQLRANNINPSGGVSASTVSAVKNVPTTSTTSAKTPTVSTTTVTTPVTTGISSVSDSAKPGVSTAKGQNK